MTKFIYKGKVYCFLCLPKTINKRELKKTDREAKCECKGVK